MTTSELTVVFDYLGRRVLSQCCHHNGRLELSMQLVVLERFRPPRPFRNISSLEPSSVPLAPNSRWVSGKWLP